MNKLEAKFQAAWSTINSIDKPNVYRTRLLLSIKFGVMLFVYNKKQTIHY